LTVTLKKQGKKDDSSTRTASNSNGDGYAASAIYDISAGAGYTSSDRTNTQANSALGVGDADLIKYIDVAATYYFNKNMSTFVDYKINRLSDDNKLGLNNDDVVALGLTYQF